MDGFFEKIEMFFKDLLANLIIGNMDALVVDLNDKVAEIGTEVAKGPATWNGGIFTIIKSLSNNVILPIASIIITYVLVYELYHMAVDQNNMKEFHVADFYKYLMKSCISVLILTKTFDIVMAIFDVGSHLVDNAIGHIGSNILIDLGSYDTMYDQLVQLDIAELIMMVGESLMIRFMVMILAIVITVILYGRMIEIYLYLSVAPIPFAAFGNKELSSVSQNYVKGLLSMAFQGFFIIVCVAIYAELVSQVAGGTDIHKTLIEVAISSLVLLFVLLKSGSISKSIFGAH